MSIQQKQKHLISFNLSRFAIRLALITLVTVAPASAIAVEVEVHERIPKFAAPKIVVSVLPVHSLVSELLHGVGSPQLLIAARQSPHLSSLKPSQVALLQNADLIIWVGPLLEKSLQKIIAQQRGSARIITLMSHPEMTLLPQRSASGTHHHGSDESQPLAAGPATKYDPHIWLSLTNAEAIARIVTRELVAFDASNRHKYEANADHLVRKIAQLRESLGGLRRIRNLPYIVFHDAYRYFEEEFGLQPIAVLAFGTQPPGAKRIRQLKRLIKAQNIRCVFSEPQFRPGLVGTLVENTQAKASIVDPLGVALRPGVGAWFELIQGVADSLTECLQ